MRKNGKKLTALVLAAVMVLGLAACGKKSDAGEVSGTVYVPQFIDCKLDVSYINSGCCDGRYVYVLGEKEIEHEETDQATGETYTYYDYVNGIYRVSVDGTESAELENFEPTKLPEGDEGSVWINDLRAGADGTLWVSEAINSYVFDLPADFDETTDSKWNYEANSSSTTLLRQLDSTGSELSRIEIGNLQEKLEADYVNTPVLDNEGNLYVSTEIYTDNASTTKIVVLDQQMNILFELEGENLWGQMIRLGNGSVGMLVWGKEGGQTLKTVDKAAKDWGAEYALPANANNVYAGAGEYLFYYENGDSLYGYKMPEEGSTGSADGEKLLSWIASDINKNNMMFFTFLSDGRVVAMTREWRNNSAPKMELALLTPTDASTLPEKTYLTYACMYLDYDIRNEIIAFNKRHTDVRIEVKDYSEYITEEDYNAGLTKLNTEIGAGVVPDIMATSQMPIRRYGARGILEDLWKYIDSDSELGRENLMENVFKAVEQDGKLYQIFDSFSIQTVCGAKSVVGDRMGWTLQDLKNALATMPEGCTIFGQSDTKAGMLSTVLAQNMDNFVDWSTGKCSFDSQEFRALLEFCNKFPLEFDWENYDWSESEDEPTRIQNGAQMLMSTYLYDLQSIQMYKAMFGGEMTYIGYPREDGSVGSAFSINSGMAMSTTCKNKEAAWEFMREILLSKTKDLTEDDRYGYYGSGQFSTNKQDFDYMVKQEMTPQYETDENGNLVLDEDGNPIEMSMGGWGWGSLTVEIHATKQEDYDQFMALYNAIDTVYSYDEEIYKIVNEVAQAYFNGDKTAEDAVTQIQSRVNLYVNEIR